MALGAEKVVLLPNGQGFPQTTAKIALEQYLDLVSMLLFLGRVVLGYTDGIEAELQLVLANEFDELLLQVASSLGHLPPHLEDVLLLADFEVFFIILDQTHDLVLHQRGRVLLFLGQLFLPGLGLLTHLSNLSPTGPDALLLDHLVLDFNHS